MLDKFRPHGIHRCAKTSSIFRHANHRSLLPHLFRQHSDRQNSSIRRHRLLLHEPRLSGKRPRRHQRNNIAGLRRSSHRRNCRAIPRRQRTKNQLLRSFNTPCRSSKPTSMATQTTTLHSASSKFPVGIVYKSHCSAAKLLGPLSCSQYRLSENIPQVSILKHLQGFCRCAAGRGHILP